MNPGPTENIMSDSLIDVVVGESQGQLDGDFSLDYASIKCQNVLDIYGWVKLTEKTSPAIKYEPSTINLVLGTSYKFTVTLTGYSADYHSKLSWMLDSKKLTPEAVSTLDFQRVM